MTGMMVGSARSNPHLCPRRGLAPLNPTVGLDIPPGGGIPQALSLDIPPGGGIPQAPSGASKEGAREILRHEAWR